MLTVGATATSRAKVPFPKLLIYSFLITAFLLRTFIWNPLKPLVPGAWPQADHSVTAQYNSFYQAGKDTCIWSKQGYEEAVLGKYGKFTESSISSRTTKCYYRDCLLSKLPAGQPVYQQLPF